GHPQDVYGRDSWRAEFALRIGDLLRPEASPGDRPDLPSTLERLRDVPGLREDQRAALDEAISRHSRDQHVPGPRPDGTPDEVRAAVARVATLREQIENSGNSRVIDLLDEVDQARGDAATAAGERDHHLARAEYLAAHVEERAEYLATRVEELAEELDVQ